MNNGLTKQSPFTLIPRFEAISPEALGYRRPRRNRRVVSRINMESDLFWSPLTDGPYLVPVTRWVE